MLTYRRGPGVGSMRGGVLIGVGGVGERLGGGAAPGQVIGPAPVRWRVVVAVVVA